MFNNAGHYCTVDAHGPGRSERGLCPRNRGGSSKGGAAPLRSMIYEPERMRRLGFEYHSIGRRPVYPG